VVARAGTLASDQFTPSFDHSFSSNITGLRGYYSHLEGNRSGKSRAFRSLDRILKMLRELGYFGPIQRMNSCLPGSSCAETTALRPSSLNPQRSSVRLLAGAA
jgi:hypothetical protein